MSDRLAILRACRDFVQEHTPRLALADWLEETFEPIHIARAELIRLQLQKAITGPDASTQWRIGQLVGEVTNRWFGGDRPAQVEIDFELGLLANLTCTWETWDKIADLVYAEELPRFVNIIGAIPLFIKDSKVFRSVSIETRMKPAVRMRIGEPMGDGPYRKLLALHWPITHFTWNNEPLVDSWSGRLL